MDNSLAGLYEIAYRFDGREAYWRAMEKSETLQDARERANVILTNKVTLFTPRVSEVKISKIINEDTRETITILHRMG